MKLGVLLLVFVISGAIKNDAVVPLVLNPSENELAELASNAASKTKTQNHDAAQNDSGGDEPPPVHHIITHRQPILPGAGGSEDEGGSSSSPPPPVDSGGGSSRGGSLSSVRIRRHFPEQNSNYGSENDKGLEDQKKSSTDSTSL